MAKPKLTPAPYVPVIEDRHGDTLGDEARDIVRILDRAIDRRDNVFDGTLVAAFALQYLHGRYGVTYHDILRTATAVLDGRVGQVNN